MALLNNVRSSLLGYVGTASDANSVLACVCRVNLRGLRQRRSQKAPADFVTDATTFADRQAAVLDPHDSLPYDPDDLKRDYLDRGHLTKKAYAIAKAKMKYQQRVMLNLNFDHIPIDDQIVLMFPGQGAQHVGMGGKVVDHPASSQLFEEASAILGYDLLDVCRRGPKTKLDQTIHCQSAVFVTSMAALAKLKWERHDYATHITAAAGFSVGEYCALVAADVLSFADAVKVIKVRAEAMHRCCELVPSGMLTVRVTAASRLDEAMKEARELSAEQGQTDLCDVANYLYCGVKVIGGSDAALNHLVANANRHKFQVIKRLPVAGAFHTSLMASAETSLAAALADVTLHTPRINVYSNVTGKIYQRKQQHIRRALVNQVSAPVKWEQIMQLLFRMHKNYTFPNYIEVGPGRQLGAILRQISKKAYENYTNYAC